MGRKFLKGLKEFCCFLFCAGHADDPFYPEGMLGDVWVRCRRCGAERRY